MRWYMVGTPMKYEQSPVCRASASSVGAEPAVGLDAAAGDERVAELIDEAGVVAQRNGDDRVHAGVEWNNAAYVSEARVSAALLSTTPFGRLVVPDV